MRESRVKLLVKSVTVVAVIIVMAMLTGLTFQYISLNNLKTDEQQLESELATLVELRENYESEYDYMQNNQAEFVEDYVREVFGWGREGEIKFEEE